jgi:NhaA family Na+:H+ antiporter
MRPGIEKFLEKDSAPSILLVAAAVAAMVVVNSPIGGLYDALLELRFTVKLGDFGVSKAIIYWINDGLMALFFLMVGLELKREMLEGHLRHFSQVVLPAVAAIGGVAVPAMIYTYINKDDPQAMQGWAIPAATDIAFALGVLSFLGNRVPASLKIFLMTLAIIDDLMAIVIIALFYTTNLSVLSLQVAAFCLVILFIMNRLQVATLGAYLIVGLFLWMSVLKSGVHATLAGVALAFFIPNLRPRHHHYSMLDHAGNDTVPPKARTLMHRLEDDLVPLCSFLILPIFAFANSGIDLGNIGMDALINPVALGIALALFFGNQIGVMGLSFVMIKSGLAAMPKGVSWIHLWGLSMLCGIGFTMSLFIGSLAFANGDPALATALRLGIMAGSITSAACGYLLLRATLKPAPAS